jgi:transmembrane sensor
MITPDQIESFAQKLANGSATKEERELIIQYLQSASREDAELFLDNYYQQLRQLPANATGDQETDQLMIRLMSQLDTNQVDKNTNKPGGIHRIHVLRTAWFRYAAAAIVVLSIGAYLWNNKEKETPSLAQTQQSVPVNNDVLPGSDKAILTLSNGEKIELNATQKTIEDGKLSIHDQNGSLTYTKSKVVVYNTMTTPKGGQYQLVLPDGTHVWLNAESSITYPSAFTGEKREVKVTGELYFEVAHDAKKHFVVAIEGKPSVEVLGTHFNIKAYTDEPVTETTLLEGSVKTGTVILKPGQQARVTATNKISVQNDVDIEKVMSWRNGKFNFEDLNVEEVMKLIGRWYDIEVVYENKPPDTRFFGSMSRSVPLSTVLKGLEKSKVEFTIEGNKLIVR